MKIIGADGRQLTSDFFVESFDGHTSVVLNSAGRTASTDYPIALGLLLERLADLDGVIVDAFVDSRVAHDMDLDPEQLRLILRDGRTYPLRLAADADLDELRRALSAAQESVAQQPDARGGNRNKRIRLVIAAHEGRLPDGLAEHLATGGGNEMESSHVVPATKAEAIVAISGVLGIPASPMSLGSSVTAPYLASILKRLGLDPAQCTSNPRRLAAALSFVGETYDAATDSSEGTPSKGGNTVPLSGLLKLLNGVRRLDEGGWLLEPGDLRAASHPSADADLADAGSCLLELRGDQPVPEGAMAPQRECTTRNQIFRDPAVAAWVRKAARGRCESCGSPAPFVRSGGLPYLEVHHVVPLGKGGSDRVTNAVAVCPNCHRACHFSADAPDRTSQLYGSIDRLVRE